MERADGSLIIDTEIDTTGFDRGSKELERAADSLGKKLQTVQKALEKAAGQYQKALGSGNAKDIMQTTDALDKARTAAAQFQKELDGFRDQKFQTDDYKGAVENAEKAEAALSNLYGRKDRMKSTGVKESSAAFKNLEYDISQAEEELHRCESAVEVFGNQEGGVFSGTDTTQFNEFADALDRVKKDLEPV